MKKFLLYFGLIILGFVCHKAIWEAEQLREVFSYQSCLETANRSKESPSPYQQCKETLQPNGIIQVLLYQPMLWERYDPFYAGVIKEKS